MTKLNTFTAALLILMIIYGVIWEMFLDPLREGSLLWLKVSPLAFFVLGAYQGKKRTYQILALLIWLYICEALVRIFSDPEKSVYLSFIWLTLSLALWTLIWRVSKKIKSKST
ncbi:MAG: hypothetical protein CBC42_06215 [Betaproteobacteria bacterium TMED82]|nr:MAG: hypothetical protein CBC42_06215 [Betaproteobacteria bacterium TMED82]|tara:strand:- start:85191 stop:85529 length:339 start_codon:yes stop_codon:yes gene_type:complete